MASTTRTDEFLPFKRLPPELRIIIWELLPQPTRVIGQVACGQCCFIGLRENECQATKPTLPMAICAKMHHPDWRLRVIVQPRTEAIFPPLHACSESRAVWLPRYYRPPRYIDLDTTGAKLRFDVPFISYDADILTVFHPWNTENVMGDIFEPVTLDFDPLLGLDRNRIQHVGLWRMLQQNLDPVWRYLDVPRLPSLRSVSLILGGPKPIANWNILQNGPGNGPQMARIDQMARTDVGLADFQVCDFAENAVIFAPPVNNCTCVCMKPDQRRIIRFPKLFNQSLSRIHLRDCLWHAHHWDTLAHSNPPVSLSTYKPPPVYPPFLSSRDSEAGNVLRAIKSGWECSRCWHPYRHDFREMLDWVPPYEIGIKFLCEKTWLAQLEADGAFEDDTDAIEAAKQINVGDIPGYPGYFTLQEAIWARNATAND